MGRDHSFRLGADIYENPISVCTDNYPFNDFAAAKLGISGGLFFKKGCHCGHWLLRAGTPPTRLFRCQRRYLR
jgi:hypothetical protein